MQNVEYRRTERRKDRKTEGQKAIVRKYNRTNKGVKKPVLDSSLLLFCHCEERSDEAISN
ncbi:MAG: hypothetical protein V1779_05260 [bacterium]